VGHSVGQIIRSQQEKKNKKGIKFGKRQLKFSPSFLQKAGCL
jgi:hypothetical protein